MTTLAHVAAVALGGALGSLARWGISAFSGEGFPWATLLVNASGSLLIGLVYGVVETAGSGAIPAAFRLFAAIGFLGAFTTFSTFSYETLALVQQGHVARALGYVASSTLLGVALAFAGMTAGMALGRAMTPLP